MIKLINVVEVSLLMSGEKIKVRLLFWGKPKGYAKWPNIYFDTEKRAEELRRALEERFPDFSFIDGSLIAKYEDVLEVAEKVGEGGEVCVLIFHLASGWFPAYEIMKKIPTVVMVDPYLWGYAGMITHVHGLSEEGRRGFIVSSSSWKDIELGLRVIKAYATLKSAKILLVGTEESKESNLYVDNLEDLGVEAIHIGFDELKEMYEEVSLEEAKKLASELRRGAEKIVETEDEEIVKGARMYYALQRLAEKYGAIGVSVDCLRGFYANKLPAYPCIAFSLLDDGGEIMASCEYDVHSLLTKIIMREIAERPGFISEPAIDTSKNLAIYAHCVSPRLMNGFGGEGERYWIRTHAEDDKGATLEVFYSHSKPVTIVKVIPEEKRILLLKGELLGSEESEGGCRCKAVVRVGDAQKLADHWQHSWHRVLYYGDWTREVTWLGRMLGYEVFWEPGTL